MASKKNDKQLNWLDMVPVLKEGIGTIVSEEGLATITIPRFKKAWMAKFFLPKGKKNEIKIKLDENGTRVWMLVDGKRNVETICNELSEIAEEQENYNERIILFLKGLYQNNIISMYCY